MLSSAISNHSDFTLPVYLAPSADKTVQFDRKIAEHLYSAIYLLA
jgi:hypothetical protein